MASSPRIDWQALRSAATLVAQRAYTPYSGLGVGAAGLTRDGRQVTGCNVENASFGLTLCAECGLVSDLHSGGGGELVAVSIVDRTGSFLWPCGRCRQVLHEAGGAALLIDSDDGPVRLDTLLPNAFGPEHLP